MRSSGDALAGKIQSKVGTPLDAEAVREEFPILGTTARGKPLVYLDNAATTQKPLSVIEAEVRYYREANANVHRGVHYLSEIGTAAFEESRDKVRRFLNARETAEIVFVRGTTEAVNLVANSYGRGHVREGDEILITEMEHHSNIVPWQLLCEATGASLKVARINDAGELDMESFESLLGPRTRMVAAAHVANALGTINPVRRIIELAHARGIPVLLDGAQATAHLRVDVRDLDCDFYALSGHKMYATMGIGVLYGKREHLDAMPPYQGGGDMIRSVTFEKTVYNDLPFKFEAGTPNVAGAIALGAAVDFLERHGLEAIAAHETEVLGYATQLLASVPGVKLVGTAREKASVLSFLMESAHPHDIGTILDREGIAIRAGHHCAQPVMHRFNVAATARASFAAYNTRAEAEALAAALHKVNELFA